VAPPAPVLSDGLLLQLLLKPKFSCIEKIKTIGSTYMLASGLRPGEEENSTVGSSWGCLLFADASFAKGAWSRGGGGWLRWDTTELQTTPVQSDGRETSTA
jgi:hypothetical protein